MATSGSVNLSTSRDSLIKATLRMIGAYDSGESIGSQEITDASESLNFFLKAMNNPLFSRQMWALKRATVFPEASSGEYSLGPTGDHATHTYKQTTMRVAGVATDTTLELTSTSGMTAADNIGIELDNDTIQWTTITSITDSDTLVIPATGLTSAAAVGNYVYAYTSKMYRPIEIVNAFTRDSNSIDLRLKSYERDSFWAIYDKTIDNTPTAYYYVPAIPDGTFYTNYRPNDMKTTMELVYRRPFEDFDGQNDEPDVPQEMYRLVKLGLGVDLCIEYGLMKRFSEIKEQYNIETARLTALYSDNPRKLTPVRF